MPALHGGPQPAETVGTPDIRRPKLREGFTESLDKNEKETAVEQSAAVSFSNQVSLGVVPQRQVPEDLRLNALILRRAPGAAHPAAVPLPVLKEVNEVKPDLLHPLGGGVHLAVKGLVLRLLGGG